MSKTQKVARIIITKKTQHEGTMRLRAGVKGTGQALHEIHIWPDSGPSVDAATNMMYERANQLGYVILQA